MNPVLYNRRVDKGLRKLLRAVAPQPRSRPKKPLSAQTLKPFL
ncbi:MAG TPA: hypothetical protein VK211_17800 [Kamptonema sp.]|nr:hypothetical protein [Kamptonema sp.]